MEYTLAKLLKPIKKLSRRQKIILLGALVAIFVLPVTVFGATRDDKPKKPHEKPHVAESKSKPKPAKKSEEKKTTQETPADTQKNQVASPTQNQPKATTPSSTSSVNQNTPPATRNVDFALTANSLTIRPGEATPVITAHSNDGQPLAWAVFAPTQAYIFVASGITHGPSMVASHSFTFSASGTTMPGTYTAAVRGYLPRGAQVEKTITIIVVPLDN